MNDKTTEHASLSRRDSWARRRHVALVALTAFIGFVCFRSSYFALRDRGPAVWALALMLSVLAAASWALTLTLIRSRRATRAPRPHATDSGPPTVTSPATPDATSQEP